MAEKWQLIIISRFGKVGFFSSETWADNYKQKDFLIKFFPEIKVTRDTYIFGELITALLNCGWEPFSLVSGYDGKTTDLGFRRKNES